MSKGSAFLASWLGQSGTGNSRIEAFHQSAEDSDVRSLRAMWEEAVDAAMKAAEDAILPAQASIGGKRKRGQR